MNDSSDGGADLLHGVKAIASFLGLSYWQTYGLIRQEGLPAFRLNGKQCARRATLRTWLKTREAQAGGSDQT